MDLDKVFEYSVKVVKDRETGQVVVEVPTLGIADYGADSQKAFQNLRNMVAFHLECLLAEGKPIPVEKQTGQGLYLKVRYPKYAA